ncbi:MAG: tape measure protein, partial [Candidatus Limnocylindrus sp.]
MAQVVGDLVIRMAADVARVKADMDAVRASSTKMAGSAESAAMMIKRAFAGVSIIYLVHQAVQLIQSFADIADGAATVNARLKLASAGAKEYEQAQAAVYKISQANGTSLRDTATLYARLVDPLRKLGFQTQAASDVTEAMSLALRITGASTSEAQSAIIQFSQAMGSGTLRGEEFNSVNEAAPRLMQALEAALGKTRGELRKMAEQGQLTSDVVANALITQLQALRRDAESMPMTIGMSFQALRNEITLLVGAFNEGTNASGGMVSAINAIAGAVKWIRGAISEDMRAVTQAMQAAEAAGAGWLGQLNSGLGMAIGRALGLQHVTRDVMTWENAVKDAEETLAKFNDQEARGIELSFYSRTERYQAQQDLKMYRGLIDNATKSSRAQE